jgi:hypothetical protein
MELLSQLLLSLICGLIGMLYLYIFGGLGLGIYHATRKVTWANTLRKYHETKEILFILGVGALFLALIALFVLSIGMIGWSVYTLPSQEKIIILLVIIAFGVYSKS